MSLLVSAPCCVTLAPFQGTIRPPRKAGGLDARMIVCRCQNGTIVFLFFVFCCLFVYLLFFFIYFSLALRGEASEGHFARYMFPVAS